MMEFVKYFSSLDVACNIACVFHSEYFFSECFMCEMKWRGNDEWIMDGLLVWMDEWVYGWIFDVRYQKKAIYFQQLQYITRNMHTVFALLCFVVVIHWLIFPYPSGLLHWHCGNLTIAPVPAKQPWWIWINTSCEFIMNDCITTTKQSTTKPCAYLLGYTVLNTLSLYPHTRIAAIHTEIHTNRDIQLFGFL